MKTAEVRYGSRHTTESTTVKADRNYLADGRGDSFYRFSVKCNRIENAAISRLAKAEGLSPTAFVQAHFERLFAKPEPDKQEQTRREDAISAAKAVGVRDSRLLEYMKALADRNGNLTIPRALAAQDLGFSQATMKNAIDGLVLKNQIVVVSIGNKFRAPSFKIVDDL